MSGLIMANADEILATGGPGMVRAAYSSGKPALGVGPVSYTHLEVYKANMIIPQIAENLTRSGVKAVSYTHLVSLKKGLAVRTKDDIDILTAENGVNVKQDLMELCEDQRVHLAEAIVFCTTIGEKWSLDILSQNLDYLPYDVVALGHTLPYENMVAEEKLDVLMQRKIYTYNCISAVVSYLGYYKKYEVYSDAANDTEIVSCIEGILKTLNHCICEEYQITSCLLYTSIYGKRSREAYLSDWIKILCKLQRRVCREMSGSD